LVPVAACRTVRLFRLRLVISQAASKRALTNASPVLATE